MAYFVLAFFILSSLVAPTTCGGYQQLPGQFVDISAKGNELWALDRNRSIFRFNFDKGEWNQVPADGITNGQPNTIGASPDGWTWITTTRTNSSIGNMFRYNPGAKKWDGPIGGDAWLKQISATSNRMSFGQGGDGRMWTINYPILPKLISGKIEAILWGACGGDECWLIEKGTRKVWRTFLKDKADTWVQMPGVSASRDPETFWVNGIAETIDVQSSKRGVMTTTSGRVYMWTGDRWNKLGVENAAKATIGWNRVFILDEVENVIMAEI